MIVIVMMMTVIIMRITIIINNNTVDKRDYIVDKLILKKRSMNDRMQYPQY